MLICVWVASALLSMCARCVWIEFYFILIFSFVFIISTSYSFLSWTLWWQCLENRRHIQIYFFFSNRNEFYYKHVIQLAFHRWTFDRNAQITKQTKFGALKKVHTKQPNGRLFRLSDRVACAWTLIWMKIKLISIENDCDIYLIQFINNT